MKRSDALTRWVWAWGLAISALHARALAAPPAALPFGPGERLTFRLSYARIRAGTAWIGVESNPADLGWRLTADAKSHGFFAWLFRYRVEDRTVARFDPSSRCSLGIEKHLREGKFVRDEVVTFDRASASALVERPREQDQAFPIDPCTLDVLSALFMMRTTHVGPGAEPEFPVFDNKKRFVLGVRFVKRETLDLPPPWGKKTATVMTEPRLVQGTGLFVREGRLFVWFTDDARRVPVKMTSKVPLGSVVAELEEYRPPDR